MITAGVCENVAPYAMNVWRLKLEWLAGGIVASVDENTLNLDYDIAGGNIEGAGLCRPLGWYRCKWGKSLYNQHGTCGLNWSCCYATQQDLEEYKQWSAAAEEYDDGPDSEREPEGWEYEPTYGSG